MGHDVHHSLRLEVVAGHVTFEVRVCPAIVQLRVYIDIIRLISRDAIFAMLYLGIYYRCNPLTVM